MNAYQMFFGAGLIMLALLGCESGDESLKQSGAAPLSETQLHQLHGAGVSASFVTPEGVNGNVVYYQDGSASVTWSGASGVGTDTGVCRIAGNTLCATWKAVRDGQERFFHVFGTADRRYKVINPDGSLNTTITVRQAR